MVSRISQLLGLLLVSWCVMTLTHELGHLLGGWLGGGTLQAVELAPWRLPYSFFEPDPHPLITLWSGPLLGVLLPLICALIAHRAWVWLIAHFCLLANGVYLAAAWYTGDQHLDTARLLENGASPISLIVFCVITIGWGYSGFRRSCAAMLARDRSAESQDSS